MRKRTQIRESVNLEFRMEAFNVFNHTNLFISNTAATQNVNSTTFGQTTSPLNNNLARQAYMRAEVRF